MLLLTNRLTHAPIGSDNVSEVPSLLFDIWGPPLEIQKLFHFARIKKTRDPPTIFGHEPPSWFASVRTYARTQYNCKTIPNYLIENGNFSH